VTTITDLVHDVTNYLVAQAQQNTALGAAFTSPVLVIDGPTVNRDQVLTVPLRLWIGYDAITGMAESGSARQRWPFVGVSGAYREEEGSLTCTAEAWTGDPTASVARASCKAVVGAVEIMLRGAPATGGPGDTTMGGLVQWSQIEEFTWFQDQSNNGMSAACVFRVTWLARLPP